MPLNTFNPKYQETQTKKLEKQIDRFQQLLKAFASREIPEPVLNSINEEVGKVNKAESKSLLTAQLSKSFQNILKIAEKELNLVAKNHYRNTWLAIGMSAFGIPLGLVFSSILNNYGFIGVGLPIGMGIGIAIGSKKDKQALDEDRQLNVEI
jgi:hypothetical protein